MFSVVLSAYLDNTSNKEKNAHKFKLRFKIAHTTRCTDCCH